MRRLPLRPPKSTLAKNMDREVWQTLLSLESRDLTKTRFRRIHSRDLSTRRAREINAAAKQGREYFRNAGAADYSVRPLLTFYGVTSLSRALLLLLKPQGGEECLTAGHGLEALAWRDVMSGETAAGLRSLPDLRVRTCAGLFSDFAKHTDNRVAIHINSSGVDWRLNYDVPDVGLEVSVSDLFSRLPDLRQDYSDIANTLRYSHVSALTYTNDAGFSMTVLAETFSSFQSVYEALGYNVRRKDKSLVVECSTETLDKGGPPLFVHGYLHKRFGAIPQLFVVEPFAERTRYSQLCITYVVSFLLGMLARYYPTHWIALVQGHRGDRLWPTISQAQRVVEESFPELVAEMVKDATATGHPL